MGVLDDAIREHLELKRRRGADPTEIERAEREALGPVRRGPEVAEADDYPAEVGDQPPEYEQADDEYEPAEGDYQPPAADSGWDEDPFAEEPTEYHEPAEPASEAVDRDEPEPPAGETGSSPFDGESPGPDTSAFHIPLPRDDPEAYRPTFHDHGRDEPPEEPEPPRLTFASEPRPDEPESFDEPPPSSDPRSRSDETIEYDVAEKLGKDGEDVLEETPEFLQDAPEHDRLWFEQRPPKDFDFNE
jgi:hypothetical protein